MGPKTRLTPRQSEIMGLAAKGLTDKEISQQLRITVGTLRSHWDRMRTSLKASSRSQVIACAYLDMQKAIQEEIDVLDRVLTGHRTLVWTLRHDGFVDYCNEWFQGFSGLPTHTFLGSGCRRLMAHDQRATSDERWHKAQRRGEGYEAEVLLRDASGTYVPHLIRLTPLQRAGGVVVTWLGIAERQATPSERRCDHAPSKSAEEPGSGRRVEVVAGGGLGVVARKPQRPTRTPR